MSNNRRMRSGEEQRRTKKMWCVHLRGRFLFDFYVTRCAESIATWAFALVSSNSNQHHQLAHTRTAHNPLQRWNGSVTKSARKSTISRNNIISERRWHEIMQCNVRMEHSAQMYPVSTIEEAFRMGFANFLIDTVTSEFVSRVFADAQLTTASCLADWLARE